MFMYLFSQILQEALATSTTEEDEAAKKAAYSLSRSIGHNEKPVLLITSAPAPTLPSVEMHPEKAALKPDRKRVCGVVLQWQNLPSLEPL